MTDDFDHLLIALIDVWDRQFPSCGGAAVVGMNRETAELLADLNLVIRRAREHLGANILRTHP
jgi:hypothetical protein